MDIKNNVWDHYWVYTKDTPGSQATLKYFDPKRPEGDVSHLTMVAKTSQGNGSTTDNSWGTFISPRRPVWYKVLSELESSVG